MEQNEAPHPTAELKEERGLEWWQWNHPTSGVLQIELTGKGVHDRSTVAARAGQFMTDEDYVILARSDVDVYLPRTTSALELLMGTEDNPEDRLLASFRKGVFPREECNAYRDALRGAAGISRNRGNAAGVLDLEELKRRFGDRLIVESPTRASYYTKDGLRSMTTISNGVHSGIAGYFNATPRNPYCRKTAWTRDFPAEFEKASEFVRHVDREFKRLIPGRWAAQRRFIEDHSIEKHGWAVAGTAFTTMTVNRNYRTGLHLDDGDLSAGFGNLTVMEGDGPGYDGAFTVFPQYRVAVDIRMGDFAALNVHEWHGNTAIVPRDAADPDSWERISLVCYCRELLAKCGSQEEEEAKRLAWEGSLQDNPKVKHARNLEERAAAAAALEDLLRNMGPGADS